MNDLVYLTTNKINKKQYVGSHTTNDLNDDYFGSGIIIKKAIKKYGKINFSKKTLEICNTREEAVLLEEKYIKKYNTLIPNGYNISPYGNVAFPGEKNPMYGKKHSKEIKKRMSESHKGLIPWNKGKSGVYSHTEETKKKISEALSGEKNYMYGKPAWNKGISPSDESRKKMSESHKGQIPGNKGKKHTKETKRKMRGQKRSEETKRKLSESHKGQIPWMKGKKHTEETKLKISKANKGKKQTPETIEKNRQSHLGIKHTEEAKKKMSEKAKNRKVSEKTRKILSESHKGLIPWNKGKKGLHSHTEETKKKISETMKRRGISPQNYK